MGSSLDALKQTLASLKLPIGDPQSGVIYQSSIEGKKIYISNGYNYEKAFQCDDKWKEFMSKILAYLQTLPTDEAELIAKKISYQDWHWEWLQKTNAYKNDHQYEWFFLEIEESVEAACLIYFPKASSLPPTNSIFYIEYIAVAPWNRFNPLGENRFQGLGTLLLIEALKYLSSKHNTLGRFCLHSLAQAETFYTDKLKMTHVSTNDKQNMKYFEIASEVVPQILGEVA